MIAVHRRSGLLILLVTLTLALSSAKAASQFEVVIEAVSASTGATPVACPDPITGPKFSGVTCIAVTDGGSLMADVDRSLSVFVDGDWFRFKLWGIPLIIHTPTDSLLAIFVIVADAELPEFTGVVFLPFIPALK